MITNQPSIPACRVGVTQEQLQREADRAVLYGACLLVLRPDVAIKAQLRDAVMALQPAVQAYFAADGSPEAAHAAAYADAAGGRSFLDAKAAAWRERHGRPRGDSSPLNVE
jgi:hypothetical protein